jgi:hypothetical protein
VEAAGRVVAGVDEVFGWLAGAEDVAAERSRLGGSDRADGHGGEALRREGRFGATDETVAGASLDAGTGTPGSGRRNCGNEVAATGS